MDKEIEILQKQISDLKLHNRRMSDALERAMDYFDNLSDVVDADGLVVGNEEMLLLSICERAYNNKSWSEY